MREFCFYIDWQGLSPEAWAAWVQAIGSILGIGAAVGVPWWLFHKERNRLEQEKAQRAKGYALFLLPMIRNVASVVRHAEWRLKQEDADHVMDEIAAQVVMPPDIQQHIVVMHELGKVGGTLQDALQGFSKLSALLDDHQFYLRYGGHIFDHETGEEHELDEPPPFSDLLRKVKAQLADVESSITSMFD